jgi:hypothetical protein
VAIAKPKLIWQTLFLKARANQMTLSVLQDGLAQPRHQAIWLRRSI